jgi:hypothetical protein
MRKSLTLRRLVLTPLSRFSISIWRLKRYLRRTDQRNLTKRIALVAINSTVSGGIILSGLPQVFQVLLVIAVTICFGVILALMPSVVMMDKAQLFREFEQRLISEESRSAYR